MKQFVLLLSALWIVTTPQAQVDLNITTDKTTSLIFSYPVKYIDRGSKDILVQTIREQDNVILVKAASVHFSETNLTVVTSDGNVYSFRTHYSANPDSLLIRVPPLQHEGIQTYAKTILDNPSTIRGPKENKWGIHACVAGVYIREAVMYFQLRISNDSPIDYTIDLLRFYVRDQNRAKRTAVQEVEIVPVFIAGNTNRVRANSVSTIVVATDQFTIPDAKVFVMQVMEKNGGRHLQLKLHNKHLLQAISLPDLH